MLNKNFANKTGIQMTNMSSSPVSLKLHGMSWGVKTTCFKAPGVSLGGSGVSIGGVRSLRVICFSMKAFPTKNVQNLII